LVSRFNARASYLPHLASFRRKTNAGRSFSAGSPPFPKSDSLTSEIFARWLANLRDGRARARINARIRRLSIGNPGDTKSVGGGVSEMRIDYGPGHRVYFIRRGEALVILVAGGDKRTQDHDIAMAIKLARDL
jgi:putative addiction module killer protein